MMMNHAMKLTLAAIGLAVATGTVLAQHGRPYSGLEQRPIKALSSQQIDDLRAGRGMGLALPAELNGYPGPSHTLELAQKLHLDQGQTSKVRELFDAMKAETIPIGERLIRQETDLDRQFASKTVTPRTLSAATIEIGETQAELRNAHLKYHLATVAILTDHQVRSYGELRGYAGAHVHK